MSGNALSSVASQTKKRPAQEDSDQASASKIAKTHPFFNKQLQPSSPAEQKFQWLKPLGGTGSCLHGVNLSPKASKAVAAFDLDGTVIKSDFVKKISVPQWEWWRSGVPAKLQEVHESGYSIVIISNQGVKPQVLKAWKHKIPLIADALPTVPFRIFAATSKDNYRKPMIGMWSELERIFAEEGVEIDKSASFFVGDAAGRQYPGRKADFASTDRKWAINVGLPFYTPEEYFLGLPPHTNFTLPGFNASSLPKLPHVMPSSSPLLPDPLKQEVVLFVGYPCLGKSSFFRHHFRPADYVHVNQDILKTRDKCVKHTQEALENGQSCVIDNTNRNASTRKYYIDLAKRLKVPIRCFLFSGSIELAWHNNLYRAYNLPPSVSSKEPSRDIVPYTAFSGFRGAYEEPRLDEGFSEIKTVNWVFEGSEDEKKYWSMWLQIDGK
ncbi:polynucleotide kinase 3 phosphatase-domain-containing protein [Crucibulum laeve]|uniref:Polynucleotide kinase 3 phosphatase-domain-containing protein n=1 Tax=Crucibulum laeve TaxID=68775 RepID=A0A5C3MBX3_9AGAR|nr:polynucleotide kinase 3 phosphatase-domain-containing protein [Crucibulum laeve]